MHKQGTEGWLRDRLGKVTASKLGDVLAKGGGAARANYLAELVVGRLTGEPGESYENDAMKRGKELEPLARSLYELTRSVDVVETGFVDHPSIEMAGASPDGLVGDDGVVEIKCRNAAKHIAYWLTGKLSKDERCQMQWEMECTGRAWVDFVSFHPDFPDHLQLYVQRLERDEAFLAEARATVGVFQLEVAEAVEKLEAL